MTLPTAEIDTGAHGRDDAVGTKIYRQLTAPYEDKKETRSGKKKTTITSKSGSNDDAFDAALYAWMGYHVDGLGPVDTTVRFTTRRAPGY